MSVFIDKRTRPSYTASMPRRDTTPPQGSGPSEVVVRLKPIFGIRPGTWLTALYAVAIVLVLFFVLFYPGLRRPGSYLVFTGLPARATVRIDGRYAGSTPCTVFVSRGNRSIEVVKPFYSTDARRVEVPGRVFASLIVPRKQTFEYHLDLSDSQGLFAWALDDFARNPLIPEIVSKTVSEVISSFNDNVPKEIVAEMLSFVDNAMLFDK